MNRKIIYLQRIMWKIRNIPTYIHTLYTMYDMRIWGYEKEWNFSLGKTVFVILFYQANPTNERGKLKRNIVYVRNSQDTKNKRVMVHSTNIKNFIHYTKAFFTTQFTIYLLSVVTLIPTILFMCRTSVL